MSVPTPQVRFHYLGVLEALHKRCSTGRKKGAGRKLSKTFERLRHASPINALIELKVKILGSSERKTKKLLEIGAVKAREHESKMLEQIDEALSIHREHRGIHPRPWPPLLTVQQITERFVALALGLHAGDRVQGEKVPSLAPVIGAAASQTIAPALSWALLMEIGKFHENEHSRALEHIRKNLSTHLQGDKTDLTQMVAFESVLKLAKAWHEVLASDLGLNQDQALDSLAREIVRLLESDRLTDNQSRVFRALQPSFGWGEAGTARALAVEQARKAGGLSARRDTRLTLLEAAHSSHVLDFRTQLERNVLSNSLKSLPNPKPDNPLQLAGEAFWLSRACFRETAHTEFDVRVDYKANKKRAFWTSHENKDNLDQLSQFCYERLTLALKNEELSEQERLTLHRFRAGFATNPRYWKSSEVLSCAEEAVEGYKKCQDANQALVAHFEARLIWMQSANNQGDPRNAFNKVLEGYTKCLVAAGPNFSGLDAEAPVHFFPELFHLLEMGPKADGKRAKDLLETIDFILSRNFGVYMDIETERAAIIGGMSQAGCIREANSNDSLTAAQVVR